MSLNLLPPRADETMPLRVQTGRELVKWVWRAPLVLLSYLYENGHARGRDHGRDHGHGHGHGHWTEVWEEKGFCFAPSVLCPSLAFSASWAGFLSGQEKTAAPEGLGTAPVG